jgi:hypothetical protein
MKEIRWIPVEEKLPSYGEEVIMLGPRGGLYCGFFRNLDGDDPGCWEWTSSIGYRKVSWWMPRSMLPPMPVDGQSLVWYCEAVAGEAGHARDGS